MGNEAMCAAALWDLLFRRKGNNRIRHHHLAVPSEPMDPNTEHWLMLSKKRAKIRHPVPTGKRVQCHLPNGLNLNLISSLNRVPSLQKIQRAKEHTELYNECIISNIHIVRKVYRSKGKLWEKERNVWGVCTSRRTWKTCQFFSVGKTKLECLGILIDKTIKTQGSDYYKSQDRGLLLGNGRGEIEWGT